MLGVSSYTYAEASWGQSQADFLASHVRAFEFFGGVPDMLVPDNLKSAVIKACRYDPEVNPHYQHLFKKARVNIDYHIRYKEHAYSVPHALVREEVEVRAGEKLIQILLKGKPVTSHSRKRCSGYTTKTEHMPKSHQKHQQWTPGKLMSLAKKLGPDVLLFTRQLLDSREHPEQAYRACLGFLNMSRDYGADRLNAACARARHVGGHRIRNVKEILLVGLDQLPLEMP